MWEYETFALAVDATQSFNLAGRTFRVDFLATFSKEQWHLWNLTT